MTVNPIATAEQHDHERAAVALFAHPTVRAAYDRVKQHWLENVSASPDMLGCYDDAFEEVMFGAVVWSMNQDPLHPLVVTITRMAHRVGDLEVPGSRWGLDNPDSVYRVIPISGDEKYLIHGRVAERRLTENYFTLWDDKMNTVDVLSGHDLVLEADRSFTIEVDAEPANGRPNHIRSAPEAKEFYIRDVLLDWARDVPNELWVERVGAPAEGALGGPATVDEQAEQAAEYMLRFADLSRGWNGRRYDVAANQISLGWTRDTGGALRNQVYVPGRFELGDGEALVLDINDGGAAYFTVPITNLWGTTLDLADRTCTLNKAQSLPNPDGSYTYVISREDPGVHNWLDTCGMSSGILTVRMAEFPDGRPNEDLSVTGTLVRLDDLPKHLPDGTPRVSAEERSHQREDRAAAYSRRLAEG